jgi:hypothetical protein
MGKVTDEMKEFINNLVKARMVGFVATASKDGIPNLVPKGSLGILDDDNLVFADFGSERTLNNIRENPKVSATFVDVNKRKGYQFKGNAEILDSGPVYDEIVRRIEAGPVKLPKPKYAVKIEIKEVYNIPSRV